MRLEAKIECFHKGKLEDILINILTYAVLTAIIVYGVLPLLAEELFR